MAVQKLIHSGIAEFSPASYPCQWTACLVAGTSRRLAPPLSFCQWYGSFPYGLYFPLSEKRNMGILLSSSSSSNFLFIEQIRHPRRDGVQCATPGLSRLVQLFFVSSVSVSLKRLLLDILNKVFFLLAHSLSCV